MLTIIYQRADGTWAVVVSDISTSVPEYAEWGLPTQEAAMSLGRASLSQHNVINGRHGHAATWGW